MTKKKFLTALVFAALLAAGAFGFSACKQAEHEHIFSEEWSTDGIFHWHACTVPGCDVTTEKEDHKITFAAVSEATCTQEGENAYICNICGYEDRIQLSPLGHDLVHHDAKAATCTEPGWKAYETCSRCDYSTYTELPALQHDLQHYDAKAATCTESGWTAYETCSRCGYSTYTELPALQHDLQHHDAKAATCTEPGWKAYETCSRCDYSTYTELPALQHDLQRHDAKAATCTEPGWTAYETCSRCDYSTYTELPALQHDLQHHDAKAATCTEPGSNAYETCSRCDYSTYEKIGNPLGHILNKNICTRCGKKLSEGFLYGYSFLASLTHGKEMQLLYEMIDDEVSAFHYNVNTNIPEDLVIGTIYFDSLHLTTDEARAVWTTYKNDQPLYYWLCDNSIITENEIVLTVRQEYASATVRDAANDLIDQKATEFKGLLFSDASPYDIALAYHDAIILSSPLIDEDNYTERADTVTAVFDGSGATSKGYARAFQLLLNYSEIENIFVTGTYYGTASAWNLVKLDDGEWYWCDLSLDVTQKKWGIEYRHFCINDYQDTSEYTGSIFKRTFLDSHTPDTSKNLGVNFLYDLPARSFNSYTSTNLMLYDTFTADNMEFSIIGYNTAELHYVHSISDIFVIPENVETAGRLFKIISVGSDEQRAITYKDSNITVTAIHIPATIKFIWDNALNIPSVENYFVAESNPFFSAVEGVLFTKSLYTLIRYPSANARTEYIIPAATHYVAYSSFTDCAYLQRLTVSDNVTSIGVTNYGRGYSDEFDAARIVNLDGIRQIFGALTGNKEMLISEGNKDYISDGVAVYDYAKTRLYYVFDTSITSFRIPSSLEEIDGGVYFSSSCFSECTLLEEFTVEDGNLYFSVLDGILYNKDFTEIIFVPVNLQKKELRLPDSISFIGHYAFNNCKNLQKIILPESIILIDDGAFYGCTELNEITIPQSVTTIEHSAFNRCTNLTEVYFADTEGWSVDGQPIDAELLSNPETAAKLLTETYFSNDWQKN